VQIKFLRISPEFEKKITTHLSCEFHEIPFPKETYKSKAKLDHTYVIRGRKGGAQCKSTYIQWNTILWKLRRGCIYCTCAPTVGSNEPAG